MGVPRMTRTQTMRVRGIARVYCKLVPRTVGGGSSLRSEDGRLTVFSCKCTLGQDGSTRRIQGRGSKISS